MRKSWHEYFLDLCDTVATRATCPRRHVGCVITKGNRLVATGYNGSLPGEPHCEDVGCNILNNHCVRTIHAEHNALLQLGNFAFMGPMSRSITTLYCKCYPCADCARRIAESRQIHRVIYRETYGNEHSIFEEYGVEVIQFA